jgi:hypothetical protein
VSIAVIRAPVCPEWQGRQRLLGRLPGPGPPVVKLGKDLVKRSHVAVVVVHVFRQQSDARGVLAGEPLCHQPIPVQIGRKPLDFLVPRLQAVAAEKRSEQLQRAGFYLDLGLERLQV